MDGNMGMRKGVVDGRKRMKEGSGGWKEENEGGEWWMEGRE